MRERFNGSPKESAEQVIKTEFREESQGVSEVKEIERQDRCLVPEEHVVAVVRTS